MTKLYTRKTNIAISYHKDKTCIIFHREDGPAVEYHDGSKLWYLNNKRHRADGPAIEWADGTKYWYVNGECYSEKEHKRLIKMINFL